MADNYRDKPEWQALNRIWKAVPAAARDGVKDDFRIITELIKAQSAPSVQPAAPAPQAVAPAAAREPDTNFLAGLSAGARKLALTLLTREGFNVYDYLRELAVNSRAADAGELFDAYVSQRDIGDEDEAALMEIIEACMARAKA